MKKKFLLAAAVLAVALYMAARLLLPGSGGSTKELSLWYMSGPGVDSAMEALAESCAVADNTPSISLSLRSFPDEESLSAALARESPELLYCSWLDAARLGEEGLLDTSAYSGGSYIEAVSSAVPFSGLGFYPIGMSVPVLVYDSELFPSSGFDDLDSLYNFASLQPGSPVFALDNCADFLYSASLSLGYEPRGEMYLDSLSADFCTVYNCLSHAAEQGSFLPADINALEYLLAGELSFACLPSTVLAELPEDLGFCPLPLPEGGEKRCSAKLMGFALFDHGKSAQNTARSFLGWLEDQAAPLSLDLGLVPAASQLPPELGIESPESALLLEHYRDYELVIPSAVGEYAANAADFENQLRQALDLLY